MIPSFLTFSSPAVQEICNHLWQSTVFGLAVALLVLALRRYPARARYWLWMAASAKFLIPFSILIAAGSHLARPTQATLAQTSAYIAIDELSQPFTGASDLQTIPVAPLPTATHPTLTPVTVFTALWLCGLLIVFSRWLIQWRNLTVTIRNATPLCEGRVVETLHRIERIAGIPGPIQLLSSAGSMEPGVFGVFRPVLLWPEAISLHLDDSQLEAVLAHEAVHIRRRDNLTSLLHMVVEAIFWFHPLVWWMESQLVKERERACDEEVLLLCHHPQAYAESILKVCELCIESPLTCVSGITGADLKKRIVQIMTDRVARKLNLGRKLLLLAVAAAVVAGPLALGMLHTIRAYAQVLYTSGPLPSFEVATIRPMPNGYLPTPTPHGGSTVRLRFTPKMMIMYAYNLPDFSEGRILKSGGWTEDNYEVEGKISDSDYAAMQKMTPAEKNQQIQLMVQSLLKDRMKLKVHLEKREETVYSLEVAKGGAKLTPAKEGLPKEFGVTHQGQVYQFTGNGGNLDGLALQLGRQPETGGRSVVNKTGITGSYDVTLRWTRTGSAAATDDASTQDGNAPSFFTAIQEQLGLRLVTTKDQVDYVVVDHIEKPTVDGAGITTAMPILVAQANPPKQALEGTPGRDITATWQGTLHTGRDQRFVAKITKADDGTLRATFYIDIDRAPDVFHPISTTVNGSLLKLELPFGTYEGTLSADGNSITGTWRQGQNAAPLNLARATTATEWTIRQPPRLPAMAADANPAFEVATIKASRPDEPGPQFWMQGRRFSVIHTSMSDIINFAYGVQQRQVAGAPDWFTSERYDISAVPDVEGEPNFKQWQSMVKKLMGDRFQLKFHYEKRELPVYALTVAKMGAKLTRSQSDPSAPGGKGFGPPGNFGATNATMADVADALGYVVVDRPVVDQTGLTGKFDLRLRWTPDGTQFEGGYRPSATDSPDAPPDLFTAIQQELGLKLESTKARVNVLVIDHVERPSQN